MIEHFFSTIPGIITGVGIVISGIIAGFLYIASLYDKQKRAKKDEENKDEDRLINLLKDTVDELTKKVDKQTLDIEELTKKVDMLERDNENYIKIFQGRDKDTQDFYKAAYGAIDTVHQTHDIMTTVAESIKNTNSAMEKLIEVIGKSIDIAGRVATNKP